MKLKSLVLVVAPAMLIATGLRADADTAESVGKKKSAPHAQEALARFDKDGDGMLNDEEKAAARAAMKEGRGDRRDAMLSRLDTNGDGTVDESERAAAREAAADRSGRQGQPGPMHAQFMKRYDADGDGKLSADEKARGQADWKAFVAKHDTDGDGKLSPEESTAARAAWAKEHPAAAARLRKAADADGDGTVSPKERRAAAKEVRKKRANRSDATESDAGE